MKPLETFDPRPIEFKGTAGVNLPALLDKVRGNGLAISLLLDRTTICWSDESNAAQPRQPQLPSIEELRERVAELKKSLQLPAEKCREIEAITVSLLFGSQCVDTGLQHPTLATLIVDCLPLHLIR